MKIKISQIRSMVEEAILDEKKKKSKRKAASRRKSKKKARRKKRKAKRDACYHKVKSRYDVWPSAYASGALVKCRKVGAKNWGNKSKKESLDRSAVYQIVEQEFSKLEKEKLKKIIQQLKKSVKSHGDQAEYLQSLIGEELNNLVEKKKKKSKKDGKGASDSGYSLRDWFKGGGWVQTGGKYDGKPCAKQPGQKTKPYCRDADDRAKLSKKERERRVRKKRKEDPNPDRKGKAKNVSQKKRGKK